MRSSKPLYTILGAYIPMSVIFLWSPIPGLVHRFFAIEYTGPVFIETQLILAGAAGALFASIYASIMKKPLLLNNIANFRGGILIAGGAYIILSMIRKNPDLIDATLLQRLLPSANAVIGTFAAIYGWFSVISTRDIFRGLMQFESFTVQYQGEQLKSTIREFGPEIKQTNYSMKSQISGYALQIIPPTLLLIGTGFAEMPLLFEIFSLAIFTAGFLIMGFIGLLRRELICAAEGITLSVRDRSLPIPVIALGIGVTALLALAGSSDNSLAPPGILAAFGAFLGWLISAMLRTNEPIDMESLSRMGQSLGDPPMAGMMPEMEELEPWAGWQYLRYAVIVIAALLFIYFMIYPILKQSKFTFSLKAVKEAVLQWFSDLKSGIKDFFTALRDRGSTTRIKPDPEKLRKIASELMSGGMKRKEAKRVAALFARLILWGTDTIGVSWKPSMPPGEFCAHLAAAIKKTDAPDAAGDQKNTQRIIYCGELFEKALYSLNPLSGAEEKEFRLNVEGITGFLP